MWIIGPKLPNKASVYIKHGSYFSPTTLSASLNSIFPMHAHKITAMQHSPSNCSWLLTFNSSTLPHFPMRLERVAKQLDSTHTQNSRFNVISTETMREGEDIDFFKYEFYTGAGEYSNLLWMHELAICKNACICSFQHSLSLAKERIQIQSLSSIFFFSSTQERTNHGYIYPESSTNIQGKKKKISRPNPQSISSILKKAFQFTTSLTSNQPQGSFFGARRQSKMTIKPNQS